MNKKASRLKILPIIRPKSFDYVKREHIFIAKNFVPINSSKKINLVIEKCEFASVPEKDSKMARSSEIFIYQSTLGTVVLVHLGVQSLEGLRKEAPIHQGSS